MKKLKWMIVLIVALLLTAMLSMIVFATNTRNVADTVEGTWKVASSQIKAVTNNVVLLAIDLALAVLFFARVAIAYMDYRKHGQIEWASAAILFAGLVFSLFTSMYVWQIVGI